MAKIRRFVSELNGYPEMFKRRSDLARAQTEEGENNTPVALVAAGLALLATGGGCLGDLGGLLGWGLGHFGVKMTKG